MVYKHINQLVTGVAPPFLAIKGTTPTWGTFFEQGNTPMTGFLTKKGTGSKRVKT